MSISPSADDVVRAELFDGHSAVGRRVELRRDVQYLHVKGDGEDGCYLLAAVRPQPPLAHARRVVELPDGVRLEIDDAVAFDAWQLTGGGRFWRKLHYLENHLGWVLCALALTVLAGWGFLRYGVPAMAERVARLTPAAVEAEMGREVLAAMDHRYGYFRPSQLPPARTAQLATSLQGYCRQWQHCPAYTLEFRSSETLGANALALPGGIVVVTDDLVKLAGSDDEVIAVLAHELGHVSGRHALRQSLQGAVAGLVIVAFTGDFSAVASGLPAVLLQMNYSRALESEADGYALAFMQLTCIRPAAFAEILSRLGKQNEGSVLPEILASHPDTAARVQPFLQASPDCRPEQLRQ